MKEDRQTIVLTHLSQLLDLVSGFGGFIVPLVIWIVNKDKIYDMDEHGKSILNFQISMFIYAIICVPLILLIGLGLFVGLFARLASASGILMLLLFYIANPPFIESAVPAQGHYFFVNLNLIESGILLVFAFNTLLETSTAL